MARITLDRLAHRYTQGGAYAVAPMDLVWAQGGAYALLGPSGCGKTTLLNIISGLVRPSEGRVLFDDADVTDLSTEARNIAQVFQFPVVYDTMTVRQNFRFPLKNRGVPEAAIEARVAEIAALLDMTSVLDRPARNLTADARQKISLGRGLVRADVAAILFDEPLTVIDPQLKWELRSKLKALHRQIDMTMIYVTHDQTEALTFADQVLVMNAGEMVQAGTPEQLFSCPEHVFVGHFIGSPGMNFLPCTLTDGSAIVGAHVVALGTQYGDPPGMLQLGIRPEFATLAPEGGGIPATVQRIEDLGRARLARCLVQGMPFVATVPDGVTPDGDAATIALPTAHLHLYADSRRVPPPHPVRETT